jgi:hypothetical protein
VIAAGKRLGSYEVISQLGAGGIGEVYVDWTSALPVGLQMIRS